MCRVHGGAAPQVKRAAERRLEELRPDAIRYYDWLLNQEEYPSAGLGAANAVMDRVDGRPTERIELSTNVGAKLDAARQAALQRNTRKD